MLLQFLGYREGHSLQIEPVAATSAGRRPAMGPACQLVSVWCAAGIQKLPCCAPDVTAPLLSPCCPLPALRSAPEVLTGQRCTDKADIFSLGIVIWEVCTGHTPVRGDMRELRQALPLGLL